MKFTDAEKEMILISMVRKYNRLTYTHHYIFGFVRNGLIYAVQVDSANDLLNQLFYAERRTNEWVLKYRPNKKQQEIILANAVRVEILGSVDWLENEKVYYNNNRGDTFEYHACKVWGGTLSPKRNAKFTDCGDFWIGSKHFQCKFGAATGAATFTNESTLNRMGL